MGQTQVHFPEIQCHYVRRCEFYVPAIIRTIKLLLASGRPSEAQKRGSLAVFIDRDD